MPTLTLKERLTAAIVTQQDELRRIQSTFDEQNTKVRARLMQLQNANDALTPQLEAVLTGLESVGVSVTFNER